MICAVLSLVVLRLEARDLRTQSALVTELFVEDMEGQLREFGVNDVVVGKRMGGLMSALGGRLGALRMALAAADLVELTGPVDSHGPFSVAGPPLGVSGGVLGVARAAMKGR